MGHLNHELEKGQPNGVASLGSNLKLQVSQKQWYPPLFSQRNNVQFNFFPVPLYTGVGVYELLLNSADSNVEYSCPLQFEDVPYDGSTVRLVVYIELVSNGGGGDNVKWIANYAFLELGDDGRTKSATLNDTTDVSSINADELTRVEIGTISGNAGAFVLNITLTRDSTGGGSDSYPDDVKLWALRLEKV